jgi:hypothetical protein
MLIRFIGDRKGDGPAVLIAHGCRFPKGEWVNVPETVADFLKGNWHFEFPLEAVALPVEPEPEPERITDLDEPERRKPGRPRKAG